MMLRLAERPLRRPSRPMLARSHPPMTPPNPSEPTPAASPKTFTGRGRRRQTRKSVKVIDAVARYGITIGGLAVVAALTAIVVFLVVTVLPLFQNADADPLAQTALPAAADREHRPVALASDDNLLGLWTLDAGGEVVFYHTATPDGAPAIVRRAALSDRRVTAISESLGTVGIGREDGSVLLGQIRFDVEFPSERPAELAGLEPGQSVVYGEAIADVIPNGSLRLTTLELDFAEPLVLEEGVAQPVEQVDYLRDGSVAVMAARRADGAMFWGQVTTRQNLRTGAMRTSSRQFPLPPARERTADAPIDRLFLARGGTNAFLLYEDGHLVWYDTKSLTQGGDDPQARIAEEVDLLEPGQTVAASEMLLGDFTIVVADSDGGVSGWFAAPDDALNPQGWTIKRAHELAPQPAPVTAIALGSRDRQFLTGDAQGNVWLRHMSSNTTQARLEMPGGKPVSLAALAPTMNRIFAVGTDGDMSVWTLDNPHPDGKLPALFLPVHYEGRAGGEFVWQSSAAGDDVEPKLSLIPLVWGTLKATVYAMLFATPIAILAAIYSSEFMQPRVRSVVKPSIEMMAGLPSVVLGYIAASVLAPWAEDVLGGLLLTFAAVPTGVMIFGFLWQLVPPSEVNRQGGYWALGGWGIVALAGLAYLGWPPLAVVGVWALVAVVLLAIVLATGQDAGPVMPFLVMAELVLSAVLLGLATGPFFETLLFGGDLRAWLRGAPEGWVANLPTNLEALPGWVLMLTPLCIVGLVLYFNASLRHRLRIFSDPDRTRAQLAVADLIRFAVVGVAGIALAAAVGLVLSLIGLDLRADFLGPITDGAVQSNGLLAKFDPRNALNVGMIMGFAIIPIIYTVSEDALTAVPNTLRSAALGAGATPWQTAIRVVLPVATSGIFSACMIGLGRAVGETMIVLMAAGNTETTNLNIFDGMKTMSANIATEMPEAPVNGTLYRVLFFSGLVLFAMTFVVNTLAELVRIRFRRRAFQL